MNREQRLAYMKRRFPLIDAVEDRRLDGASGKDIQEELEQLDSVKARLRDEQHELTSDAIPVTHH